MRLARWKAATALVAAGMLLGSVAGYAVSSSADTTAMQMAAGTDQAVHCQGPQLRTAGQSATDLMLTCDPNPVTTTTTAPATTTTTAPQTTTTTAPAPPPPSGCGFASAPGATAAFCDTFDAPAGTGNRSGDLNGTVWGVSRALGQENFGQGQYAATAPTQMDKCGTTVTVQPPADVAICNGQVTEAVNDQGIVTSLAMYPKQPFDIAGRTGTMSFDVSDDSHGNHTAWPEIWYTDTPAPDPFTHFESLQEVPANAVGIRLENACVAGNTSCVGAYPGVPSGPWVTVGSADVVTNYVSNDTMFGPVAPTLNVQVLNAVRPPSGPGQNNHFEIRYSTNQIDVYGTDAGTVAPLRHLAVITGFTMPLTRGLLWMEDGHYNGNKEGIDQGTHTFTWDNFGFDGPVLPRDLTFDVLDANSPTPGYPGLFNEGWNVPTDGATLTVHTLPITAANIAAGSGAALLLNTYSYNPVSLQYKINGGAWQTAPWPYPCLTAGYCAENRTAALAVSKTDVVVGVNTIQFKSNDATAVSNIDLALLGAGG